MNYIHHLNNFYRRLDEDPRMKGLHISLYMALFRCWNYNHFPGKFHISRARLMQTSRIGSANTIARMMRELHSFGYIRYYPSRHIGDLPKVAMVSFEDNELPGVSLLTSADTNNDTGAVSDLTGSHVKNDTCTMSKMIPIIKQYINNENNKCVTHPQQYQFLSIPSREEVLTWFSERGAVTENALAFFFHYSANGWMIGKHPIKDWKAAAEKWMITTKKKTDQGKASHLHTNNNKNYSAPL